MNKIAAPSGGGDDRTTFVGVVVPASIKALPKVLTSLSDDLVKELVEAVATDIAGQPLDDGFLMTLAQKSSNEVTLHRAFGGLHNLVTAALRHPPGTFKKQQFSDDLRFLGLSTKVALEIQKIVLGPQRVSLESNLDKNCIRLPTLTDFKWRVDVAISTSELQRAMKPAVLMQMTLSDGTIQTFEMPVEEFHKLRYNVSYVLKEMEDLEKRGVLQAS
mmetsp:Transcript_56090/g.77763  ORF Transcript_56090/g.77763 Transcript_56090/m.77763 type:complete len:217 (-) Transcript_56090:26-676(-)